MFKKLFYDYVHILWKEDRLTLIIDTLPVILLLLCCLMTPAAAIVFFIFLLFLLFRLRFRFFLALSVLLALLCFLSVIYFYPYLNPYKNRSLFPPDDPHSYYNQHPEKYDFNPYYTDFSHIDSSLDYCMLIFHPSVILAMLTVGVYAILFSPFLILYFLNLPFSFYLKREFKAFKKIPFILIYFLSLPLSLLIALLFLLLLFLR